MSDIQVTPEGYRVGKILFDEDKWEFAQIVSIEQLTTTTRYNYGTQQHDTIQTASVKIKSWRNKELERFVTPIKRRAARHALSIYLIPFETQMAKVHERMKARQVNIEEMIAEYMENEDT